MSIEKPMEPAEEGIEIILEGENATPEEVPPAEEPAVQETKARSNEMDEYSRNVQKRINQLNWEKQEALRKVAEAERKAAEADAYAQQAYEENQNLKQYVEWGQGHFHNERLAKLDATQQLAERALKEAHESGNSEDLVKASSLLSQIAAQKAQLSMQQPPQPQQPQAQPVPQNTQQVLTQPQEPEYSATAQTYIPEQAPVADAKAQEWHIRNPWFGKDKAMTNLALDTDERILAEGIIAGSDEYYAALDEEMYKRFPDRIKGQPRRTSPVAPAGRTPPAKKVMLSPDQVKYAKKHNIPLERLAREQQKLQGAN
jgi:hypothetical protein